jgi:hypothetical protein
MKERCPKCGSEDFAVARDMVATRACKCGHRWLPELKPELDVKIIKDKVIKK